MVEMKVGRLVVWSLGHLFSYSAYMLEMHSGDNLVFGLVVKWASTMADGLVVLKEKHTTAKMATKIVVRLDDSRVDCLVDLLELSTGNNWVENLAEQMGI
jgi:hypothetical protein